MRGQPAGPCKAEL